MSRSHLKLTPEITSENVLGLLAARDAEAVAITGTCARTPSPIGTLEADTAPYWPAAMAAEVPTGDGALGRIGAQ